MYNYPSEAFVIFLDNFNNRIKVVKIITKSQGFLKVFIRKENYVNDLQVGSFITYTIEQRGKDSVVFISCEVIKNFINIIYFDRRNLYYFNSMRLVLNKFFMYNENIINIYKIFKNIMFLFEEKSECLVYSYMSFLLSVVAFFGANIIKYDNKNFYDANKKIIHMPDAFLTFEMKKGDMRQFVRNIDAAMQDVLKTI
jgi:recombinational DNA repair protein (RecF pathway)